MSHLLSCARKGTAPQISFQGDFCPHFIRLPSPHGRNNPLPLGFKVSGCWAAGSPRQCWIVDSPKSCLPRAQLIQLFPTQKAAPHASPRKGSRMWENILHLEQNCDPPRILVGEGAGDPTHPLLLLILTVTSPFPHKVYFWSHAGEQYGIHLEATVQKRTQHKRALSCITVSHELASLCTHQFDGLPDGCADAGLKRWTGVGSWVDVRGGPEDQKSESCRGKFHTKA